ncbi:hypothetical protein [Desulfobaculum bizertense]|uniref:Uncharacterized protein n=1 Tax=Desulfobaculum bizertense DSM 18034 TaxID=1121442 RepID=A0A1T4VYW4_9BACT|nr:hypothetical protein [Desulfobaculum bizertense]SKA69988.1 hypothetical protein SAMN02745702_01257 [Desulfobaculum bizertense DSM 18034]
MLDEKLRKEFEEKMPPVFAGTQVDELTGGAVIWRTLKNMKSNGEIPGSCFLRQGKRKLVIRRDEFLNWWFSQLVPEDEVC